MTNYIFAPSPNFGLSEYPFVTWDDGFSEEEIMRICKMGAQNPAYGATIDGGNNPPDTIRKSKVSWIQNTPDTMWLYDRLAFIARNLNGKFYQFDLHGFSEDFQFTIYEGEEEGHYAWHQDCGVQNVAPRKLSMVIQLSEPNEYEGGDLQLLSGSEPTTADKAKGKVVMFPSYMLHRVTPVTSGIRKTLVVWITGPSFK